MSRDQLSWGRAFGIALAIFIYFAFTCAWLPSAMLKSSLLSSASRAVADGITIVVWGGFFGAGVFALRWAQDRGLI